MLLEYLMPVDDQATTKERKRRPHERKTLWCSKCMSIALYRNEQYICPKGCDVMLIEIKKEKPRP